MMHDGAPRSFPFHKVHFRRPGVRTVKSPGRGPRFALAVILVVNGISLGLLGWGVYQRLEAQESAEKHLQVARPSSKLKAASAELPVVREAPAPPSELKHTHQGQEPVLTLPGEGSAQEPPLLDGVRDEGPAVAAPPSPFPAVQVASAAVEPEAILAYSTEHQGDTPMTRNWKTLELAAILAGALTAQPVVLAGGTDGKKPLDTEAILKRLDEAKNDLKCQLRTMSDAVGAAFKKVEENIATLTANDLLLKKQLEKVEEKMAKLQEDVERLKKPSSTDQIAQNSALDKAMQDIKTRLGDIEQSLSKLQTSPRTAFSAPAATGRFVFHNLYPQMLLLRVNGKDYRVAPNVTSTIDGIAAGPLTYEVIADNYGLVRQRTQTLSANETLTITAR